MPYYDQSNAGMLPARPGIGYVPEFQVSSVPWVTSSIAPSSGFVRYDFPTVTRFVKVKNVSGGTGPLLVGFSQNVSGSNGLNYQLSTGQEVSMDVRINSLYVAGNAHTFSVLVGLTGIEARQLPVFSGSVYNL